MEVVDALLRGTKLAPKLSSKRSPIFSVMTMLMTMILTAMMTILPQHVLQVKGECLGGESGSSRPCFAGVLLVGVAEGG